MSPESKWPVTLTVEIESEGLKQVVKEGRLMEFVHAFSTLAGEHIRVQLVDELAKAGAGLSKPGNGVKLELGFTLDDKYGTKPHPPWPWPGPWPKSILGSIYEPELRHIVRQEFERMK